MKQSVPFSLPLIDDDVIKEMNDTLINTGWVTTGPKTRELEHKIEEYTETEAALCVNSWTSGAMLMLRWFGVGPGDEIIIPAYTYSATALCVMNVGAVPVMVDVKDDFTIDPEKIRKAITKNTKAIIPVDLAGWPCDYDKIYQIIREPSINRLYTPNTLRQRLLGRIFVLVDAAHSFGAIYKMEKVGRIADVTVFSFHSAKNITTGEGGGICLNLPAPFNNKEELAFLRAYSLNGQNKSAFDKNKIGGWRYDITEQGMKVNMPDLCAAMGLAQIRKYGNSLLPERSHIFDFYSRHFAPYQWAILPIYEDNTSTSSYHLYLLRIKGINEGQRDRMIELISLEGVGVNVHYIPMPMLTLFKEKGYIIQDYSKTYELYANEITLPVYNGLTEDQLNLVVKSVINSYEIVSKEHNLK